MEKFTRRLIDKHFKKSEKAESEKKPKVKKEKKAKVEEHLQIKPESIPELELKEDKEEEDLQEKTNPNGISFLEKTTFAERVKKLQNDGLASVRLVIDSLKLVRLVQKECPTSINDSDERIEIILDQLDKKTYEQLNR